jgi:hypothetical protein
LTDTELETVAFDVDGEEAQNHFDQIIKGLSDRHISEASRY